MPRLRTALATIAAGLMLMAAGCSGGDGGAKVATIDGSDSDSSSSSNGGGGDGGKVDRQAFEDALLRHAQCMRDHGVDMPDPTFDGNGGGGVIRQEGGGVKPDSQTFKDAEAACKSIMDEIEQQMPKPSPEEQARMQDEMLQFAQCMREHGIDMPDPTFDGDGKVTISVGGPGPETASDGTATNGPPPDANTSPRMDPAFEAAMEACQKDGKGPKIGMNGGPNSSDSSDGSD